MKKWVKWVVFGLLTAGVITVFGFIAIDKMGSEISGFELVVDDVHDNELFFVNQEVLEAQLADHGFGNLVGKRKEEINLKSIEQVLEANEYVADARATISLSGKLMIEVKQRIPVIRVINSTGEQFYLDTACSMMAANPNFSAYCLVANGNIPDGFVKNRKLSAGILPGLVKLAVYIQKDDLLRNLFTQVYVDEKSRVELISRIEGLPMRIDPLGDLSDQFAKVKPFILQADTLDGVKKYDLIDLRFSNQVVAQKRGMRHTPVSTVQQPDSVIAPQSERNENQEQKP